MSLWDPSLSIGVAEIDRHHEDALVLMDEVLEAIAEEDAPRTEQLLGELAARVARHFEEEEREGAEGLLTQEHAEGHRLFVAELERLREAFARRGLAPAVPLWMRSRIVNWFKFHIATHDAPMARALRARSQGAAPAPQTPAA